MIVVNVFDSIVDSMRATGTITLVTPGSINTTLTSVNSLVAKEWVTINSTNYKVVSVTSTSFVVKGVISEATSWKALAPYYDYGHPQEISNRLVDKDGIQSKKSQKYPLIALYTDIKIKRGDSKFYGILDRQAMSIIGQSDSSYSSQQRYANVIIPTLIPLYNALVKKIKSSKYFIGTNPELDHDYIERPFWGSTSKYGNVKHMFDDPLDAIEMSNMSMKLTNRNINC